ncbi:MAG: Fis family transcriptional regulator [Rhodobacterales bacterium]|nr:MAG: Fis family transcriptional regulator [Rhodobacterales bacterium]
MNAATRNRILVVEDDQSLNRLLIAHLSQLGHDVRGVGTGAEAREEIARACPDLILLDVRLPDCDGLDLLTDFSQHAPVIVVTAHALVEQAVGAVHAGASDYLVKPISFEKLQIAINRALETAELKRDVKYWQGQARRSKSEMLVGESPALIELRRQIDLFAAADTPVLIKGAGGTGKELIARTLHEASPRADRRFVPLDCDPSQENSFVAELFGHEAGAVTGAAAPQEGLIELAAGGTLFLRDIADLSLAMQDRLLRVLESGRFRRLGGGADIAAEARIIVATQHDLQKRVQEKRFRAELFFYLNAFQIEIPPLRHRPEDIPALAQFFLQNRGFQKQANKALTPEALQLLQRYDWPGNVRELRNAIERSVIVSGPEPEICPEHLSLPLAPGDADARFGGNPAGVTLRFDHEPTMDELRASYLRLLLERHNGNRSKVASVLGISERNTYRLIPRLLS